jgi:iron(III) transport system permease protein
LWSSHLPFLRVDVYPAAVFARLGGIDYAPGEALALALPLIPIALLLLAAERRLSGRRSFAVSGLRGAGNSSLPLGRWRVAASAGCWLVVALSIAPIASLALRAQRGGGFAAVPDWIGSSLGNSLLAGSLAATAIVVTGLVVGHGVARRRAGARVLDALAVLAFVTPAVLLGIGLIALWNRPATAFVYGGIGIIVVGYIGRYAVVGLRTLTIIIAQSSPHLEESAAAAGAGYLRRLTRIVAPLHWRGLLAAWLLALVFCLRDFEMAVLFYPPGGEPLTVRIFTLEANGPEAVVAALAVVQTAVTAGALAIGGVLLWRRSRP